MNYYFLKFSQLLPHRRLIIVQQFMTRRFCLAAMLVGTFAANAFPNLVINSSFEVTENTIGRPSGFGNWGDNDSQIVTGRNGILPLDGSQMLQFDGTGIGAPGANIGSSVYQLVDMAPFSAEIATGQARLHASAFFNRVTENSFTDTQFALTLQAHSGLPVGFPSFPSPLANATVNIFSDALPASWEALDLSLLLPSGTTYVAVGVSAIENVLNDTTGSEFDGHYADLVSAVVTVPEPPAWFLFAATLLSLQDVRLRRLDYQSIGQLNIFDRAGGFKHEKYFVHVVGRNTRESQEIRR